MGRISRAVMFMDIARVASRRSTCFRLNVGSIVTYKNNPVSIGWNGQQPGASHCAGNECPGIVPGNCGTLHAEQNALKKAVELLQPSDCVDLYVTHSPCSLCSLMIWQSVLHVQRLFFEVPYRSTEHLEFFKHPYPDPEAMVESNMRRTEVYEVTPAGYVVDYFSRRVVELP